MATANQSDFLGEGVTSGVKGALPRATTPDGMYYTDTGEPTPTLIRRMQMAGSMSQPISYEQRRQIIAAEKNALFDPVKANANSVADGGTAADFKYDPQKGQWYTEAKNGRRTYISDDPRAEALAQDTPIFTVNRGAAAGQPSPSTTARNTVGGAVGGGAVGGVPGAVAGGAAGLFATLPQASGRQLYLSPGQALPNSMPGQRLGTQAEANQANATYQATGNSTPVGGFAPGTKPIQSSGPMPTYTPGMGTNGSSALSAEAQRVIDNANRMAGESQTRANDFYSQAGAAGSRAAPQITAPSSANQQAVYDRAMGFNAQSGAAAIRAERADISGAGRLESMQLDQQGINNLEGFQNTQSQQGVNALYAYNPDATYNSANRLENFYAENTAEGANAVAGFRPTMVQQDAQSLRNFQADRSGIDRLNAYADEAQGPSAAQAMLRSQADADKRTMLAISRSGRGNAGGVQAQRQAMTEGGLIAAETRGQGAALAAQETEAYKGRQLQALAQAGSLISQAEAQRLQGLSAAGALMSQADQQKLQAVMAYGELKAQQDSQQLAARQTGGQLNAAADNMRLGATSNAAQLQGDMDQRTLGAIGQAAQLRTAGDQIRSNNLQAAGQIRLSGSEINQRGAIAASSADLQAQALNLQSLSLAGQVSSEIRNQDITVLRSNLDASLQTLGLNDQQVRFFNQLGSDREVASQNLQQQAGALGINVQLAQQALDLQWEQFGLSQLSQGQQHEYQLLVLQQSGGQFDATMAAQNQQFAAQQAQQNRNNQRQNQQDTYNTLGSIFQGAQLLFGAANNAPAAGNAQASSAPQFRAGLTNMNGQSTAAPVGYNTQGQVYDPFTGGWVTPGTTRPQASGGSYFPPAGGGGNTYGI